MTVERARLENPKRRSKPNLDNLTNDMIEALINSYVRGEINRAILKRRLIDQITYEKLGEEFNYSPRQIKRKVYKAEEELFKHIKP